jgi:hypothetical protein
VLHACMPFRSSHGAAAGANSDFLLTGRLGGLFQLGRNQVIRRGKLCCCGCCFGHLVPAASSARIAKLTKSLLCLRIARLLGDTQGRTSAGRDVCAGTGEFASGHHSIEMTLIIPGLFSFSSATPDISPPPRKFAVVDVALRHCHSAVPLRMRRPRMQQVSLQPCCTSWEPVVACLRLKNFSGARQHPSFLCPVRSEPGGRWTALSDENLRLGRPQLGSSTSNAIPDFPVLIMPSRSKRTQTLLAFYPRYPRV